jgi:raffinose/stachyose/melibiose transport system substrate-binding protein
MKQHRYSVFLFAVGLLLALSMGVGASAQDQVTIHWWHITTGDPGLSEWQSIADEYTAMHPNVTFDITVLENEAFKSRLVTVMQAGDPPDLFQSWGGGVLRTFADNGLLRNITPELEGDWKDSIAAQAALELYGQNGEYYGVPWDWGAVGFFYNKARFTQAGLDPENPPATWTDFLDAVKALQDAGITPLTLGEGDKWPGAFWWEYLAIRIGGQAAFDAAYSREGTFADEPFVQAGDTLKTLIDMNPFPEGYLAMTYGDQETVMGNGQAAMELMGQWSPSTQKGNSESGEGIGADLGWFPFPMVEGGAGNPGDVLGGGNGFAVGANAPDEAVDFLRFATNEQHQRDSFAQGWILPVVTGVDDLFETDPVSKAIVDARNNVPYFQLYYDQFLPPAVGIAVNDAVETLFAATGTPQDAAQAIEDSASFELSQ